MLGEQPVRIETRVVVGDLVLVLEPDTGANGESDS
jgi:hypothetical protein